MNLEADNYFFDEYKSCPRKVVYDRNRNTYYGKRLKVSVQRPYQVSEEIFTMAIYATITAIASNKRLTQGLLNKIFTACKMEYEQSILSKIDSDTIIEAYNEALNIAYKAFFKAMKLDTLKLRELFKAEKYAIKSKIDFDIKQYLSSVGSIELEGNYKIKLTLPIVYKKEGLFYIKLFKFNTSKIARTTELINLIFLFFEDRGLNIKHLELYDIATESVILYPAPAINNSLFAFDLKNILLSIDKKYITRNYTKENCVYCNHQSICLEGGKWFGKGKERERFYFDENKIFRFKKLTRIGRWLGDDRRKPKQ